MKTSELSKKIDQDKYVVGMLVVLFVTSRLLLSAMGFVFNMRFLNTAWQSVDTWLFKTDLLRSIWYLHSQPPLFNLFTGVVLKFFPVHYAAVFQTIFHLLGLALALCLYYVTRNLTGNRILSFVVSLLFILSPSLLLFENLFFYDFPVLVILTIIAFLFQKFVQTNKVAYLFAFFFTTGLLVLTRRVFHFMWYIVLAGILLYYYRAHWKRIILAAFLPLLLIFFWCGKNWYYFGKFDTSSWTGMGFFKTATYTMSSEERNDLFRKGIVSEHIFYGSDPFQIPVGTSTAPMFSKELLAIPVVGSFTKKDGGINYNNYAYIDLSHQLMSEFLSILSNRPAAYLKGIVVTAIIYFAPGSNYFAPSADGNGVEINYQIIKKWDVLFDRIIYGQPLSWGGETLQNKLADYLHIKKTQAWRLLSPGILLIVEHFIAVLYGLKVLFKKNALIVHGPMVYLTVMFLVMNILYVSAVGILAEAGENQRHRFMIEPLNWILLAFFVQNVFLRKKS